MAAGDAMKDLRDDIVDYLDLRRSLGFKLKKDERLLLDFAAFMERRGATRFTSRLALAWAQSPYRPIRITLLEGCAPSVVLPATAS